MYRSVCICISGGNNSKDYTSTGKTTDLNYLNAKDDVTNHDQQTDIRNLLKSGETDPENAGVFNLLGYSQRKLNLIDKAFVFYENGNPPFLPSKRA